MAYSTHLWGTRRVAPRGFISIPDETLEAGSPHSFRRNQVYLLTTALAGVKYASGGSHPLTNIPIRVIDVFHLSLSTIAISDVYVIQFQTVSPVYRGYNTRARKYYVKLGDLNISRNIRQGQFILCKKETLIEHHLVKGIPLEKSVLQLASA